MHGVATWPCRRGNANDISTRGLNWHLSFVLCPSMAIHMEILRMRYTGYFSIDATNLRKDEFMGKIGRKYKVMFFTEALFFDKLLLRM